MAGMSSPNSPTYTPSGTTPTAGGKGPASTTAGGYGAAPSATGKGPGGSPQYTPRPSDKQAAPKAEPTSNTQATTQAAAAPAPAGSSPAGGQFGIPADVLARYAASLKDPKNPINIQQQNTSGPQLTPPPEVQKQQQEAMAAQQGMNTAPQAANGLQPGQAAPAGSILGADQQASQAPFGQQGGQDAQAAALQAAYNAQQAAQQGNQIPQGVLDNYNQANQGQQGNQPFQPQQFLNNIQQGTGALGGSGLAQYAGATGQQFQQPSQQQLQMQAMPQQSAMPNDYYAVSGAPNQTPTASSGNPSQIFDQFNQAQNQQGGGAQVAGQPANSFFGGSVGDTTGGGTTGGGAGRGKGFRSGGAVRNISQKEINQILNALRVAREVVIKGK